MSWLITNLLAALLLPPLNLLLLGTLGLLLWHKRPRLSRLLISLTLSLLWLLSTPFIAETLLQQIEGSPQALNFKARTADAIVVLGGGTYFHAPEYGTDTVSEPALARLRYAAKLYRETGKPILVTGGKPLGNELSEAQQMKRVLEQEFNVPVRWTEGASDNTMENARFSHQLLSKAGIKRIYLVTHAWHMPRSAYAFQQTGLEVIPAATAFTTRYQTTPLAFLPNAGSLRDSSIFMHEMVGQLWYRLKLAATS